MSFINLYTEWLKRPWAILLKISLNLVENMGKITRNFMISDNDHIKLALMQLQLNQAVIYLVKR